MDVRLPSSEHPAAAAPGATIVGGGSIFDQHWWFDAACPDGWQVREVKRQNRVVASLPFYTFKNFGMRYVQMPRLTRTLEPYLAVDSGKPVTRLKQRVELLSELLALLPRHDRFELQLPPDSSLPLPFIQLGYICTVMYTFRGSPFDDAWTNMEQRTRTLITAGRKTFRVESHGEIERFSRMSQQFFRESHKQDRNDYTTIARIFEACRARGQGAILSAVNESGEDAAAAILIWDKSVLYYWMTARNRTKSGNSANALLIWEAYEFARRLGRIFDMDGFISTANGIYFSKFGFLPVQRTYVTNFNPMWSTLYGLRGLVRKPSEELHHR